MSRNVDMRRNWLTRIRNKLAMKLYFIRYDLKRLPRNIRWKCFLIRSNLFLRRLEKRIKERELMVLEEWMKI